MDRFLLAGMVFSAGMHTALIAHVRLPGAGGAVGDNPPGLELRYVETVEMLGVLAAVPPGEAQAGGAAAAAERPGDEPAGVAYVRGVADGGASAREAGRAGALVASPLSLQGTGEILRASVQDTLQPLLAGADGPDPDFVDAVRRYKSRLEAIIERESRIEYPDPARTRGSEARLQIRFSLRKDGTLESIELPSNCGGFEDELVAGLKKAARHFPAFPEKIDCPRLTFCWPVRFDLY